MMHTKDEIDQFLRKSFFAVLSFQKDNELISQLMIFGHTVSGEFYLCSENDKSLFEGITEDTNVSVLIYKEEENLNDIRQLNIQGKATRIQNQDDELKQSYEVIGEKSPVIKKLADDTEKSQHYTFIKVIADSISYITFAEIKEHLTPTLMKRL